MKTKSIWITEVRRYDNNAKLVKNWVTGEMMLRNPDGKLLFKGEKFKMLQYSDVLNYIFAQRKNGEYYLYLGAEDKENVLTEEQKNAKEMRFTPRKRVSNGEEVADVIEYSYKGDEYAYGREYRFNVKVE